MQRYQGFRIAEIVTESASGRITRAVIFENTGRYVIVGPEYLEQHKPVVGGYYVVGENGRTWFSPTYGEACH